MPHNELRSSIEKLRSALDLVQAGVALAPPSPEQLQELNGAVDEVRRTVWAGLVAEHSGDYPAYLGKVRVRRADETCWSVTEDLKTRTPAIDTDAIESLLTTVRELSEALSVIRS